MANKLSRDSKPGTLAARLLQRVPGGMFVQEQLDRIEHRLLCELKQRLDRLEQAPSVSVLAVSVAPARGRQRAQTPAALLRELLADSDAPSASPSIEAACLTVLQSLVPDEARILAALADGSGYPLIHVMASAKLGLALHPMLEYVSNIGRNARVQAPELTPAYLRHLASWGLIETAAEDPAQTSQYEILETDEAVRRLIARIVRDGERARLVRRSLKLSDFGLALWKRCNIEENSQTAAAVIEH